MRRGRGLEQRWSGGDLRVARDTDGSSGGQTASGQSRTCK